MFGSLNEEISRKSGQRFLSGANLIRYAGILVGSVLAFGALYGGVMLLE